MIGAIAGGLGVLTGLHAATWGAFKDSPFEGFRVGSFVRSLLLAGVIAVGAAGLLQPLTGGAAVVLVGLVYALERLATEWWKSILREDDQRAYTIPMRLGFRGRPVDNKVMRYAVGVAVAAGAVTVLAALDLVQGWSTVLPAWFVALTIGGAGGWATAVGGAWKDAPIEGFSGWKFLRSPVVATLWAVPLSLLTQNWVVLLLASAGFAVASIETYKTFLTGGRPPGKFAGRSVRRTVPALRRVLAGQNATLWLAVALAFAASLAGPLSGPSVVELRSIATTLPTAVLSAVAAGAVGLGLLVIHSSTRMLAPEVDAPSATR